MKINALALDRDELLALVGTRVHLNLNGFEAWTLFNILQLLIVEKGDIPIRPVLQSITSTIQAEIAIIPSIVAKIREGWEQP